LASPRQDRRARHREGVVACVLRDFIARDVEAGGVGQVVDVEGVLQVEAVANGEHLDGEASARFCADWRKMLRWPVVYPVSNGSEVGIAPPRPPAGSSGSVKQEAFSAGAPPDGVHAPEALVTAVGQNILEPGERWVGDAVGG